MLNDRRIITDGSNRTFMELKSVFKHFLGILNKLF